MTSFLFARCDSAAKGKWTEHKQEEEIDEKTLKVRTCRYYHLAIAGLFSYFQYSWQKVYIKFVDD